MDLVTSIPVRIHHGESISRVLSDAHDRVARRAYENFVERGSVHGHELDHWLAAERELIIRPMPVVSIAGNDVIVELDLPEINLPNLAVHIAPRQLALSSDVDGDGLQVCQVIDLPVEISMDGADAEQSGNTVRITAAVV